MSQDEHTVAIVSFEGAVKREVKRVREQLQKLNDLASFRMEIVAHGRVHEGDVKLKFIVGKEYGGEVSGDNMRAVLEEFMRQHGWKKAHDPVAITFQKVPGDNSDDEIPL